VPGRSSRPARGGRHPDKLECQRVRLSRELPDDRHGRAAVLVRLIREIEVRELERRRTRLAPLDTAKRAPQRPIGRPTRFHNASTAPFAKHSVRSSPQPVGWATRMPRTGGTASIRGVPTTRSRSARPDALVGVRRLRGRPYVPLISAVVLVVAAVLMTWSQQRVPLGPG
jgi:hypothetical protein